MPQKHLTSYVNAPLRDLVAALAFRFGITATQYDQLHFELD